MPNPQPADPNMLTEPPRPDPTEPGDTKPVLRRRPADVWWMVWMTLGILLLTALLVYKEFSHYNKTTPPVPVVELPIQIKGDAAATEDITITLIREGGECVAGCKIEILGDTDTINAIDGKVTLTKSVRGKWALVRNAQNTILGTFLIPPAGHAFVTIFA